MYAQINTAEGRQFRTSQSLEALANQLYDQVNGQSLLAQLKKLFGKSDSTRLFTLDELSQQIHIQDHKAGGVQKVAINKIMGTVAAGRSRDFDINFRPLQQHNKERWLGVAKAWISGRRLGHINLVQVGDIFFVEDGHHRISVARAMGQEEIEARIVVLVGTGKLPLPSQVEGTRTAGRLVLQPATG